ncbi:LamG domain-containing protein [Paenibacillus sp. IB182496]|uniref:LamG domain-containing protein n=2 Tax=Paenibacillus sabuli TaxID=2772509 RepID=A0A927BPK1_9BACL|nr:LamG domain-containing protein [Paenibacillus sabuli]
MKVKQARQAAMEVPGLISLWEMQEQSGPRESSGPGRYRLREMAGTVGSAEEGVFGPRAARFVYGDWLAVPRSECPALDFHGNAAFTLAAWIKRGEEKGECQAVAGMWNETGRSRQYCMFLDLRIWESANQVCGHVSAEGGPTPGYKYCMSAAIGATPVTSGRWQLAVFTYDGQNARVYLDGRLDVREGFNPYPYPEGLHDGGSGGSDFTVGGVDRSGTPGNFYEGLLGGLAVYDRALGDEEIARLYRDTIPTPLQDA